MNELRNIVAAKIAAIVDFDVFHGEVVHVEEAADAVLAALAPILCFVTTYGSVTGAQPELDAAHAAIPMKLLKAVYDWRPS